MASPFPISDDNGIDNDMETETTLRNVRCNLFDGSFDGINSPQFLNFNDTIPEAKDSYFEHKEDDLPAVQGNAGELQKLPSNDGEDNIRYYEPDIEERTAQTLSETLPLTSDCNVESGDDWRQFVKTRGVNEAFAKREKTLKMITSTPFRVEGLESMPWAAVSQAAEKPHCTKARPFSFEERNKQMRQRKTRQLQTILQAEKEARRFRANPVPKFLKKQSTTNKSTEKPSTQTQMSQSVPPRFKAKSPKVLRRVPFQPILPKQHLISQPIVLHSELRAQERAVFDNYLKEKERLNECFNELKKAVQKRRDEEEIIKLRRAMVPKAQPVRKFKDVNVRVPKRPLTEPTTPRVLKRQRR